MLVIKRLGDLFAIAGILIGIAPVIARLGGHYYLLGFELKTVLLGGMLLLLLACLARLELLLHR
ncbi:hypothetical protein [Thiohalophilus thiocyanatoxydans]|uniref:Uncharacterized protein n=1 Tax=Thiohalophilus thiocyanatoxydans TaxID=381308 RepID=A0A4R8J0V4_9GAMM|nr:hypothetical protein [Thiohalophilus thiocyanatoxydans]TDY03799.1 hypothetical protein EDC23_0169 [Thiohalophilus thiocyanatoxydans]